MAQFTSWPPSPKSPGDLLEFKGVADCESLRVSVVMNGTSIPVTPSCVNGNFSFSVTAPPCAPGQPNVLTAYAKDSAGSDDKDVALNCP